VPGTVVHCHRHRGAIESRSGAPASPFCSPRTSPSSRSCCSCRSSPTAGAR
jgi:hypothetical protein